METSTAGKGAVKEFKGQFLGRSAKAKLISIQVSDRTVLLPYDSETTGLDEIEEGANIVLHYQDAGDKTRVVDILPVPVAIPAGVTEIEPEDLLAIVNNPSENQVYHLIDCRPTEFYAENHLPTAVSIPWTLAKEEKAALLPENKEAELIFYCLGATCILGPNSAALAVEAGYKNVKVMLGELSEWQEIGGQLFSADSYIAGGNIVLVDLRPAAEAEAGHIPRAVNLPVGALKGSEYDFPSKKAAPIVIYGSGKDVSAAIEIIKGWGFHQVSVVAGGYDGWVSRGNAVETGVTPQSLKWQRELDDGEIAMQEFKELVAAAAAGVLIVDVRTREEAVIGKLPNSVHIPLSELEGRLDEIPVDQEIILHCATGARAQMAYTFLRQHRPKVRFLHARVSCKKDKCRIRS